MSTPASDQLQKLVNQQNQIKAARSDVVSQLEQYDKALSSIEASVKGVELGLAIAKEQAEAAQASEPSNN